MTAAAGIKRWVVSALAMLLMATSLMTAGESHRIGVLLKGTSGFWNAVGDGARVVGEQQGAEVIVRMPESESDIDVQIAMLRELVSDGIDALVIAPSSSVELSLPVEEAMRAGVRVVVVDTAVSGEMPVFIGTNHTAAGEAAGRLLASMIESGEEVAIFKHSRTSGATTLREVSAFAELHRAHADIVVTRDVFAGNDPDLQVDNARRLLSLHPEARAVLASATPGSMAMLRALRESGRAGSVKFVGFGFNLNPTVAAALESGEMHGWIAQLPADIGGRGARAALDLLQDRPVPDISFCDFLVITRDNLHLPEVQALMAQ